MNQNPQTTMLFALISFSRFVKPHELYEMAKALEINGGHCAAAWGRAQPAVVVCYDPDSLPPGTVPVLFIDDQTPDGILADHWWDSRNLRASARVYMTAGTQLNSGPESASESAGHEVLEALIDPEINQWVTRDDGIEVALEVCDPVQTSYTVRVGETDWLVPNFVTPAWFELDEGHAYDYLEELNGPWEVGPVGYVIEGDGEVVQGGDFVPKNGTAHSISRTVRRMAKVQEALKAIVRPPAAHHVLQPYLEDDEDGPT